MKRIITAAVLTILIIVYIIFGNRIIKKSTAKTKNMLKDCKTSFESENSKDVSENFKKEWDKLHGKLALFSNHTILDGISSEATALPVYAEHKEKGEFYAAIAKIERFLEQLTDEERISIESFY